jgi:hypothetical protein
MKKIHAAFAAGVVALALGACSTAQQADASAKLAQLQTLVSNGCMVVQPTLAEVALLDPSIAAAAAANGVFCSTAGAITATSVQSLISTGIPAIEKAVGASTLIPADQKLAVMAALGVLQLTATNALAVFGNATPVPSVTEAPASGVSAASTPLAGEPLK